MGIRGDESEKKLAAFSHLLIAYKAREGGREREGESSVNPKSGISVVRASELEATTSGG